MAHLFTTERRRLLLGAGAALAMPAIRRGEAAELRPIKLAWIRQFAPAALVQKAVELAGKAGLKIEMISFNRGLDGMLALQKGDVAAADCLVGYSQLCLGISEGIPLTNISGAARGLNEMLISPKGIPASDIDEKNKAYIGKDPWKLLKGKKVGTARGSQMEFLLRSYMKVHGLDFQKDITFVDLKTNTDQVLALSQGAIDVAVIVDPSAIQARLSGAAILLAFPFDAGSFASLNSGIVTTDDSIKKYGPELQTLVESHVAAIEFYKKNPAALVTDTANVTLFSPDLLRHLIDPAVLGLEPKYWHNLILDYTMPSEPLKLFFKNLYESGFVRKDVSGEVDAHVDYAMLEKATQLSKGQLGG